MTTTRKQGRTVEFTFALQSENRPVTPAGYNCLGNVRIIEPLP
jgi:hypothetical protein